MNDWWARKLAGQQPAPPVQYPMGGARGVLPPTAPPPVVLPSETYTDPRFYQQQQEEQYKPRQAQSLLQPHACPSCGSGNYMGQVGGRTRCFDCGYPVVQSTSGLMADPGAPSQAAQQVAGEGYGAQDIIGRI